MSIDEYKLVEIKQDFYTGCDPDVLILNNENKNKFWEWFCKRAVKLNVTTSPNTLLVNGDKNIAGRCFGNSQIIALEVGLDYYEGFVKHNDTFIFHGFNAENNKVHDYTALSNERGYVDINGNLPSEYFGIKINKEFIEKHNKELIENNDFNIDHLLYKMFESEIDYIAFLQS